MKTNLFHLSGYGLLLFLFIGFSARLSAQVPKTVNLMKLKCMEETDEVGSDEPYFLVTAVNLKTLPPQVETKLYGPYEDTDKGEEKQNMTFNVYKPQIPPKVKVGPFWPVNPSQPMALSPGNGIIIVTMMENDDGNPSSKRTLVKTAAVASLAASMNMNRTERVNRLMNDIRGAAKTPTGAPNFDEHIGTKELTLDRYDFSVNSTYRRKLYFYGDGGHYWVEFEFKPN